MIIKTKSFQESCKKILDAVDSSSITIVNETLELEAHGPVLYLNVTNKEYYVTVKMPLDSETDIHAVVNAKLFLNLISKITTTAIDLTTTNTTLIIKANGNYKIPMIFDKETLVDMPKIIIDNVTNSFTIKNSILQSILRYNSKELIKSGGCSKPQQNLFYIDDHGAVTYANGACVNVFTLEQPVVLTLTEKIVKLFKLFKSEMVTFTMGFDALPNGKIASKVCFEDEQVTLTSIVTTEDELVKKFPIDGIRKWTKESYEYTVTLDRNSLLDAINRLALFSKAGDGTSFTYLNFGYDGVVVTDVNKENNEKISYVNNCTQLNNDEYISLFNTNDLKLTLETSEGQYILVSFGNKQVLTIQRDDVFNIIPECEIKN